MAPTLGFLIDDSGPAFPAPRNSNPAQYRSGPLHNHIRTVWGLDAGPSRI